MSEHAEDSVGAEQEGSQGHRAVHSLTRGIFGGDRAVSDAFFEAKMANMATRQPMTVPLAPS
ncbi:MAG: hypothetical protein ACRDDF_10825 [Aeromonas sp.]